MTHPLYSLLQFVVYEEWQVFRGAGVQVKEVLKISSNSLFEESIIIERLLEETVKTGFQVQ